MKKKNKQLLSAVLVGAAAGLAAGILLAPQSGKKTRKQLAKKGKKAKKQAEKNLIEFSEKSKASLEDIKKTASELLSS